MDPSSSNDNDKEIIHYSHYIFGYGSLLCPISRAITIPTLQHRVATPVKIKHLQRMWSFPVVECGMTFMGIITTQQQQQQLEQHLDNDHSNAEDQEQVVVECAGVLVPILNDAELEQLDAREFGYERQRIEHDHVIAIPHLQHYGTYFSSMQTILKRNLDESSASSSSSSSSPSSLLRRTVLPNVWVYVQTAPAPIQAQCPIAQSYVDIILRGALSISKDFCVDVILSTRGWHAHDIIGVLQQQQQEEEVNEEEKEPKEAAATTTTSTTMPSPAAAAAVFWVNDRHDPIYVRADVDYSQSHGHEIDALLQQHRPAEFLHRRPHLGNKKSITM
jgi:hypothetical protein